MDSEELERLVGTSFPGGTYRIEPYDHWLRCDAMLAEPAFEGVAHPTYVYFAALAGMGLLIDELFAMVGATADSGVMFGETSLELERPLLVGQEYHVTGGITDVQRKTGKKAGTFDILTFELTLREPDGTLAAVSTNSFVFPRRS